ncbi:MAG: hypothetical protein A2Y65_05990 [Deltaproteobacteria bacterium RBG_13_52_11]|nr:MAG: hypothetical protein A2Y65_05990 [Deltaproteobacteria bacterium RBG_13_52_11]
MNEIYVVNLVLSAVILIFGLIGWRRSGKVFPLYIGIAFGLFGLSHLAMLLGLAASLEVALIVIRTVAYLIVVYAVYKVAFGSK